MLSQARIHTGFHRFTEIGQNFRNQKNRYVDIFLIQVIRKLNLENIFDSIFVYSFCQLPEKDKSHRQVLGAKFFTHEIDRTCVAVHSLQYGHDIDFDEIIPRIMELANLLSD